MFKSWQMLTDEQKLWQTWDSCDRYTTVVIDVQHYWHMCNSCNRCATVVTDIGQFWHMCNSCDRCEKVVTDSRQLTDMQIIMWHLWKWYGSPYGYHITALIDVQQFCQLWQMFDTCLIVYYFETGFILGYKFRGSIFESEEKTTLAVSAPTQHFQFKRFPRSKVSFLSIFL